MCCYDYLTLFRGYKNMKKTLKRSLSIILAVTMVLSSAYVGLKEVDFSEVFTFNLFKDLAVKSEAASNGTCGTNLTWELDDEGTLTISGEGAMSDFSSSSTPWSSLKNSIENIVITNGVTNIGKYAFYNCKSLISITIPSTVTKIGSSAFASCNNLDYVFFGGTADAWIKIMGSGTTAMTNTPLINAIVHPESTGHVYAEDWTIDTNPTCTADGSKSRHCICEKCDRKADVTTIPSLGGHIYSEEWTIDVAPTCITEGSKSRHCLQCGDKTDVTAIEIIDHEPSDTLVLDENFDCLSGEINYKYRKCVGCDKIFETIEVPAGHSMVNDVCEACGTSNFLYSVSNNQATITGYNGTSTNIVIPSTLGGYRVTKIGGSAFEENTSITTVTIPNSVTSIGSYSFSYCSSLTSITIPDTVTNIGSYAFRNCIKLASITLPKGITSIGSSTFRYCDSLISVSIPDNVNTIGEYAFYGCDNLAEVSLGKGITTIKDNAFAVCHSLEFFEISENVVSVSGSAFNCSGIKEFSVSKNNPNFFTVDGVLVNADKTKLIAYPSGKAATEYVVPDGIIAIGDYAFYCCDNLTSLVVSNNVTTIGSRSIYCCDNLVEIVLPSTITSVGEYALYGNKIENVYFLGTEEQWKERPYGGSFNGAGIHYDVLTHVFSDEWTIDKEATCIEEGSKSHHCLYCDEKIDVTSIPLGEHDYQINWVVEAECGMAGEIE